MLFNGSQPAVLDFEDCTNLDEECLELIFKWLYPPMIVRLKGVSIDENSTLLERLNENRYEEDEIQLVFEPKVLSIEDKLKRENKQLMEENASLRRQIDEMKKNKYVIDWKNSPQDNLVEFIAEWMKVKIRTAP